MPDEIDGMKDDWGGNIHNFYTPDGAIALYKKWKYFKKGKIVLNIAEMPIKCPVAPLEFIFMADWYLHGQWGPGRYRNRTGDPALRGLHQAGGHRGFDETVRREKGS